jgi:hypothetical protein
MDLSQQCTGYLSDAENQFVNDSGKDVPLSFAKRHRTTIMSRCFQAIYSICFLAALFALIAYGVYSIEKHAQKKANGKTP